ncbi:hypothetical protein TWF281_003877 [Arthrobotrys megalospora]
MKIVYHISLLLSTLCTVNGAAVYGKPSLAEKRVHLQNTPSRGEYPQHRHWPSLNEPPINLPLKPRIRKRATKDEIAAAKKLVETAQIMQGAKNRHRFRNPLRPKFTLRPVEKSTKAQRVGNLAADAVADEGLSEAAALIAEYEAPTYNETLPDIGPGFPKLEKRQSSTSFWMESVSHGSVAIGGSAGYQVFRNIKDFGAVGDGRTDDTAAINLAISSGDRCGANCGSSTVKPALVYFPSGTYLVSKSIIGYYNTQLVGNPNSLPIIRAASSFIGLGVISSNVYIEGQSGAEWYINQNNFMRQVRNFIIDMRAVPNVMSGQTIRPAGIHWQVAQATSLQNIQIIMSTRADTTHLGIFMENGSGGFMSDVTFSGGAVGAYLGNQQFTIRKFSFNGCKVAVETHWNWALSAKSFLINNCQVGFNISASVGSGQGTGSINIMDTTIMNTPVGIVATLAGTNRTSIMVDNWKMINVGAGINDLSSGQTVLAGGTGIIPSWGSGITYNSAPMYGSRGMPQSGGRIITDLEKPGVLLGEFGNWFERSKPQYQDLPASSFHDVKTSGARGNGRSDDTAAINAALQTATSAGKVTYFPHGMYLVTDTILVPPGAKIVGEAWSQIQGTGTKFSNKDSPHIMVKVGNPGDVGDVEIQDMLFGVRGGTAGAILVQWNIKARSPGSAALWDSHWRVGGSIGTNLQKAQCPKLTGQINPNCMAGSLLLHLTPTSSGYFENAWIWTADHDLDVITQDQIDIYVARGVLIESQGPSWFYGTASEHNVLYQYQLQGAKNIFMALIQTESPYFQPNPVAPAPFLPGYTNTNSTLEWPAAGGGDENGPGVTKKSLLSRGIPSSDNSTLTSSVPLKKRGDEENTLGQSLGSDPRFYDCLADPNICAVSWAVRFIRSQDVHIYGAGLYSWFQNYDQSCLSQSNCQHNVAKIDGESKGLRLNNLVTVGSNLMANDAAGFTVQSDKNRNGFASSTLGVEAKDASGGALWDSDAAGFNGNSTEEYGSQDQNRVVIISTARNGPARWEMSWEYYEFTAEEGDVMTNMNCNYFQNADAKGVIDSPPDPNGLGEQPYKGPADRLEGILVEGHSCIYTTTSTASWSDVGGGTKFGELDCEGFAGAFDCYKPVAQSMPNNWETKCDNQLWFVIDIECPTREFRSKSKRATQVIYAELEAFNFESMSSYIKKVDGTFDPSKPSKPNLYQFETNDNDPRGYHGLLFYTRRLAENHVRLDDGRDRPGLSDRARYVGSEVGLLTIWRDMQEGWPNPDIDGPRYKALNFYGIGNLANFIGHFTATKLRVYFGVMSTVFAYQARGTAYVMTEDPANIEMGGIWGADEYPALTRPGGPVSRIIAINRQGSDPYLIYNRFPFPFGGAWGRASPNNSVKLSNSSLPWKHPILDLPLDHSGAPWGPIDDRTPSKFKRGIDDAAGFIDDKLTLRARYPRKGENAAASMSSLRDRVDRDLPPPLSGRATSEKRSTWRIFPAYYYGERCLSGIQWMNTWKCKPYSRQFLASKYEKEAGRESYSDFFGEGI